MLTEFEALMACVALPAVSLTILCLVKIRSYRKVRGSSDWEN